MIIKELFREFNVVSLYMPKIFMNLGNPNLQYRTNALRSLNSQVNSGLAPSVRLNLSSPMINRVATAKASCGSCGK